MRDHGRGKGHGLIDCDMEDDNCYPMERRNRFAASIAGLFFIEILILTKHKSVIKDQC